MHTQACPSTTAAALQPVQNEQVHPVFAQILNGFYNRPKPIEIPSTPICTHYMFEGPMSDDSDD